MKTIGSILAMTVAVAVGGGCASAAGSGATATSPAPVVQPGAPGEASRAVEADAIAGAGQHPYTAADVAFMQDMIAHHAQALHMTGLVSDRTGNPAIELLARRIDISQEDEIILIEDWLEARGEAVPDPQMIRRHAAGHGQLMPGMLTAEQLSALEATRGPEFDRLFLESMIRHHQGALEMVRDLFASEGGGHETEIWQFASHVDADQRVEIDRMTRMLAAMQ